MNSWYTLSVLPFVPVSDQFPKSDQYLNRYVENHTDVDSSDILR
jgi:hypothetical protein